MVTISDLKFSYREICELVGVAMTQRINPVDQNVGRRLRKRRIEMGMSQQAIGEALQLSFQQIQKYESGANRIAASRLYDISKSLGVEVGYFFEDVEEALTAKTGEDQESIESKLMSGREALELLRSYSLITDDNVRKGVRSLLATLVQSHDNP